MLGARECPRLGNPVCCGERVERVFARAREKQSYNKNYVERFRLGERNRAIVREAEQFLLPQVRQGCRHERDDQDGQQAKQGELGQDAEDDCEAAEEFDARDEPAQFWPDAAGFQRLYERRVPALIEELVEAGNREERAERDAEKKNDLIGEMGPAVIEEVP